MGNAKISDTQVSYFSPTPCKIIAFPSQTKRETNSAQYSFSMRDRMIVLTWANSHIENNYINYKFQPVAAIEDQDSNEFLLIYCDTSGWSTWGMSCVEGGYSLWHSARGTTVGTFTNLNEALQHIDSKHPNKIRA